MHPLKKKLKQLLLPFLYRDKLKTKAFEELRKNSVPTNLSSPYSAQADLFTYHGEDGIIQHLLGTLKDVPPVFVDIGAGDAVKGNCTVLAVHQNWKGTFFDANPGSLEIGKRFYKKTVPHALNRLQFINAFVNPSNVNQLLRNAEIIESVGLLSIDIDGNDFWIWQAISVIDPVIVIIEAKVEFGLRGVVVPYSAQNNRNINLQYNGASVPALIKLGIEKGYSLVAANRQGYNLFFVKNNDLRPPLRTWNAEEVLSDPDTLKSIYENRFFEHNSFISIS